jgi:hypothetical protein
MSVMAIVCIPAIVICCSTLTLFTDHLIGNPLAFASDDAASKSWTRFRDIPALKLPNVNFMQSSVTSIDCENKVVSVVDAVTKQCRQEKYDYLLVASGLRRTSPVVPQALNRDQFLAEARSHTKAIRDAKEGVVVIGGGTYDPCVLQSRLISLHRSCWNRDGQRDQGSRTLAEGNPYPLSRQTLVRRAVARRLQRAKSRDS